MFVRWKVVDVLMLVNANRTAIFTLRFDTNSHVPRTATTNGQWCGWQYAKHFRVPFVLVNAWRCICDVNLCAFEWMSCADGSIQSDLEPRGQTKRSFFLCMENHIERVRLDLFNSIFQEQLWRFNFFFSGLFFVNKLKGWIQIPVWLKRWELEASSMTFFKWLMDWTLCYLI